MSRFANSCSLVLLSCLSSSAYTDGYDTELEPVIVSATRSGIQTISAASHISVITAGQISSSGALHIVDVLRTHAGVQISDLYGDGSRTSISMRGFGGNAQANVLILVDGRRLNNADLGPADLNSISLKDVERIEVVKGSAGSLFGDQAVGGVINIITRKPGDLKMFLDTEFGTYDRKAVIASVENRHSNGLGYRLSAEKRHTDNYRDHNEQDYSNLFGLFDFRYNTGSVFFEYQDINEELETPGALFADQVRTNRQQPFNPDDYLNTDTRNARLGIVQKLLDGVDLHVEYTSRKADTGGLLSFGGIKGGVITTRDHRELTPRLVADFGMANGTGIVTVGADLLGSDFFLDSILGTISNEQKQVSFYAQGLIPLSRVMTATLGLRHASVSNEITGALLPAGTKINDDKNAFQAGLAAQLNDEWRIFGRFDSNFRFVLTDEYTSASFGGVIPDSQTGRSYEAGVEWTGLRAHFNLVHYRLEIKDEIDFNPVLFINTNIGNTTRTGFSLEAGFSPVEPVTLNVHLDHVNAEIVSGILDGQKIPAVAENIVSLTGHYQINDHISGYLALFGITERIAVGDFFNTTPVLPGYALVNMHLKYEQGPFRLGLKINNLLDKEYSDNAQQGFRPPFFIPETVVFPAPERNFMLTAGFQY